jgi:hypothetical protein
MRDEVSSMMAGVIIQFSFKSENWKLWCNNLIASKKGHDTTALAFTWFLYMMAKNPEKQV